MFRWGIVSTAKIAREQLIPAIQASSNSNLQAIASRDPERATEIAVQFQIPEIDTDYDALLANPNVDGIYIPLPNSEHVAMSIKAARAGKHVLCEKPIALSAKEIRDLIAVRDETGMLISEAYMVTYHPQWAKVRTLLADGAIGDLRHVQGAFCFNNTDPENTRNIAELGGGALPDIGVYPLITTRYATGVEPVQVRATVDFDRKFNVDVYTSAEVEFEDFTLNFYVSTQLALEQSMVFHGSDGRITFSAPFNAGMFDFDRIAVHNQTNTQAEVFQFPNASQYKLQIEAFVRATQDRSEPHVSLENSFGNQAAIDAIYRAGRTRDWVEIESL